MVHLKWLAPGHSVTDSFDPPPLTFTLFGARRHMPVMHALWAVMPNLHPVRGSQTCGSSRERQPSRNTLEQVGANATIGANATVWVHAAYS